MATYEVKDVYDKGIGGHYKNARYTLGLQDTDTHKYTGSVYMEQKPETAAPKEGDLIHGTITEGEYGPRFKKESPAGKGGGFSGGKPTKNPDEFRDKFQIMRGEALAAAARTIPGKPLEEVLALAETYYNWIVGTDAPATTKQGMSLDEAKAHLVEFGNENNIPMPMIARAIEQVTGSSVLYEEHTDKLDEIRRKANEFATIDSQEQEEVPF